MSGSKDSKMGIGKNSNGICMRRYMEVNKGQLCDYFDRVSFLKDYPKLACCMLCKQFAPKNLLKKKETPPNPNNYDSHG